MKQSLGRPLYLADQVRELDRRTVAAGMDGFALMQRAAMAAYDVLRARWPGVRRLSVLCGSGNNGGDGYVMAALAVCDGIDVQLIAVSDPAGLKGEAARARDMAEQAGVRIRHWHAGLTLDGEVAIDALLGTGLKGEVREPYVTAIETINASGKPVLAVDIPSGLAADTGASLGHAVRADITVTFIADKFGLHTGAAPAHVGEHRLETLGVEAGAHADLVPAAWLMVESRIAEALPPRRRDSHKGHQGHVLVLGGAPGFGGAALLASEAAARLGAGKVSLATAREHVTASLVRCPEVMVHGVDSPGEIQALLAAADVIVIGPGLSQAPWGQRMLQAALKTAARLVVDADALNLLVTRWPDLRRDNWILTPHPGEAARLLNIVGSEVQRGRLAAVTQLQHERGGCVVLKGAGSLVAGPNRVGVCPFGNPGMASGGMGDALSGILGALLAQGLPLEIAAEVGMLLHAQAADAAAEAQGERGLLASDLASYARRLANPMES